MVYAHPVLGFLAVLAVFWAASVGLRARHKAAYAREARVQHRWAGPLAFALCAFAAIGGLGSVAFLRDDLSLAASWHFAAGGGAAAVMGFAAVSSRVLPGNRAARRMHPLFGMLAVALAVATVGLGMRLLP